MTLPYRVWETADSGRLQTVNDDSRQRQAGCQITHVCRRVSMEVEGKEEEWEESAQRD